MSQVNTEGATGRLRLMGPFRLLRPDGSMVEIASRRARGLLAYLALAPERTATRERLCGLLWSDRGDSQARASLRQCLLELRAALTAADLDLLSVGREAITLPESALETDVADLEAAIADEGAGLAEAIAALRDYRLLEDLEIGGLFDDWRGTTSARLERRIASGVEQRLRVLEQRSDWSGARSLAESYLRRDPLDEAVVACAIRANAALGATGAARRLYQTLKDALATELGASPGSEVKAALDFAAPPAQAVAQDPAPDSEPLSPDETMRDAGPQDQLPLPDKPSIAVMPFKNLSGDAEQEYFADAITEDIVAALSRWRWFFVIASDSSFAYKNTALDADRVGRELGVRYLLDGSVRRAGTRVRITARLVDARDGSHVWTDRYDRELTDVLTLQDEITEQVVAAIEPAMLRGEGLRVARKAPADFGTLDFFYRGMWHLHNMSEESDRKALALFEEVARREPEWPLGYIGLSRALYGQAVFGGGADPVALLRESRNLAATAIGLDPLDAQGYYARSAAAIYLNDHGAALADARRAVEINASFALAHVRLGQVLTFSGDPDAAIEPIERGLRLSPYDPQLSVNLNLLSLALFQARRYEEAVIRAREAMNRDGERHSLILAASLAMVGRVEEAARVMPPPGPRSGSGYRPIAPSYARPTDRDHLRGAIQLAR